MCCSPVNWLTRHDALVTRRITTCGADAETILKYALLRQVARVEKMIEVEERLGMLLTVALCHSPSGTGISCYDVLIQGFISL
jgi:hypothetical protein